MIVNGKTVKTLKNCVFEFSWSRRIGIGNFFSRSATWCVPTQIDHNAIIDATSERSSTYYSVTRIRLEININLLIISKPNRLLLYFLSFQHDFEPANQRPIQFVTFSIAAFFRRFWNIEEKINIKHYCVFRVHVYTCTHVSRISKLRNTFNGKKGNKMS